MLPAAIYADAAWMGAALNVYSNWDIINQNGFSWGKFGSYAGLGAVSGLGAATGNFWVAIGAQGLQGAGNQFVKDDYNLSIEMMKTAGLSMGSYALTAGLSKGLPGNYGLDLDTKISSVLVKNGFNSRIATYTGDYLLNYVSDFAIFSGEQMWEGNSDWIKTAAKNAAVSSIVSTTTKALSIEGERIIQDNKKTELSKLKSYDDKIIELYTPKPMEYIPPQPNTKTYTPNIPKNIPGTMPPKDYYFRSKKFNNNMRY